MNEQTARELMMQRMFETLSSELSDELDSLLKKNPQLAQEWREVQEAHQIFQTLEVKSPPSHVEHSILQSAKQPTTNSRRSYWKPLTLAASFLVVIGTGWAFFSLGNGNQSTLSVTNRETKTITENRSFQINNKPQSDHIMPTLAKHDSSKKAEQTFRTALELYNKAFSKIGEEREALLRSAIVYLEESMQSHENSSQWEAFSMILIADAYRELGKVGKSIDTYEHMLTRFPNTEPHGQKARASLIRICLASTNHLDKAQSELSLYKEKYPDSNDLYQLAYDYSSRVQKEKPKEALQWLNFIVDNAPNGHSLSQRSYTLSNAVQNKIKDQFILKDWWVIGPVNYLDVMQMESTAEDWIDNRRWNDIYGQPTSWKRIDDNSKINDVLNFPGKKEGITSSAISVTYVNSEETQIAYLIAHKGARPNRVWLNQETIYQSRPSENQEQGYSSMKISLQKGWNELAVKYALMNSNSLELINQTQILILDQQKRLLTDVTIDPTQRGEVAP